MTQMKLLLTLTIASAILASFQIPATAMQDAAAADARLSHDDIIAQRKTVIYTLAYTDAVEVNATIARIVGMQHGEATAVDTRTNAIIVAALPSTQAKVESLLSQLDQAVDPKVQDLEVGISYIKHVDGRSLVSTLDELISSNSIRLVYDKGSNSVVTRGHKEDVAMVRQLLEDLDRPADQQAERDQISLRVYWLANGDEARRELPAHLKDVSAELTRAGVEGLGLVAQTMLQVTTGEQFETTFTAMLQADNPWDLHISGRSFAAGSNYRLNLAVSGQQRFEQQPSPRGPQMAGAGRSDSISMQTTISTPGGRFIVLGMNPIRHMDSVFVVQIVGN